MTVSKDTSEWSGVPRNAAKEVAPRAGLEPATFPDVPGRQWVLSLPWSLRYLLAFDAALCGAVLAVFIRVEKLCVLVPAPRTHLLRDHGVLAPHVAWRSLVVPRSPEDARHEARALAASEPARPLQGPAPPPAEPKRLSWAAWLKRVFAWDVLHCPRCGGRRRIVAVHTRPETFRPLLARLGLDVPPAAPRASRAPPTPAA